MNRKQFIKQCAFTCVSLAGLGAAMQACAPVKSINASLAESDLVVPENSFEYEKKGQRHYRKFLIVHNERLQFPLCVTRINDKNYVAVLMRCPHQGAELQVFGDKLQCPAHGSEFDNTGVVMSPPADINLRAFPVVLENNQLKISLK